jgi:hypothetical protein
MLPFDLPAEEDDVFEIWSLPLCRAVRKERR